MLLRRIGVGLLVGVIGTAVMDASQTSLIPAVSGWIAARLTRQGEAQDDASEGQGQETSGSSSEQPLSSPEKVAKRGAEMLGISLDRRGISEWGNRVHWAYGAQWGVTYGMSGGGPGLRSGLRFGAMLWLVSDELLLWATGIASAPTRYPLSTHAQALAAHLVYGAVVGVVAKGLHD